MKNMLVYVFLFLFIVLTGFLIISETQNLDTSEWSFAGAEMAKMFVPYIGHIYMMIASGVILTYAFKGGQ